MREPFGVCKLRSPKASLSREVAASGTSRRRESACPERGGGCECNEQTEGLNRGFAICPQPLSRLAATAPRPGSLLAFCNHHPKAVPACGGFEPSAPSGRCSEGRIGRNREYCKRQRSKTTIFQPALWVSRSESRRGYKAAHCSPFVSTPQSIRLTAYCQLPVKGSWRTK